MDIKVVGDYLCKYNNVAVAFSGGVDSSVLLYLANKYCGNVKAYFVKSQFQPAFELKDAYEVCNTLGVNLKVIDVDVLQFDDVVKNPANRCYYCKNAIFSTIIKQAKNDNCTVIFDGTNASDDIDDRPGYRALQELSVISPLKILGITKSEIRALAKDKGLSVYNKPAYACLATRIPTGVFITEELLNKTEQSENYLMNLGFSDFRVRYRENNTALIQITKNDLNLFCSEKEKIYAYLSKLYSNVYLDLKER